MDINNRSALSGRQILVVDDLLENRWLMTKFLELAGASVLTAKDGNEAIEMVSSKQIEVVLMDLEMPNLNGFEATLRIRDLGFTIPIVALSSHTDEENIEKCLSSGFTGYLSKPVPRLELVEKLVSIINR